MKTKMRMLTVVKPHKYGTRHLTAGEDYEVPARHALALVAGKKARFADKPFIKAKIPPIEEKTVAVAAAPAAAPTAVRVESSSGDIEALRAQATQLGLDVDGRWGVARLRYEIERIKR